MAEMRLESLDAAVIWGCANTVASVAADDLMRSFTRV